MIELGCSGDYAFIANAPRTIWNLKSGCSVVLLKSL